MKTLQLCLCLIAAAAALPTRAAMLECREETNTRKHFCYLPSELRENADLRSFPLFTGGPKGCKTNRVPCCCQLQGSVSRNA